MNPQPPKVEGTHPRMQQLDIGPSLLSYIMALGFLDTHIGRQNRTCDPLPQTPENLEDGVSSMGLWPEACISQPVSGPQIPMDSRGMMGGSCSGAEKLRHKANLSPLGKVGWVQDPEVTPPHLQSTK